MKQAAFSNATDAGVSPVSPDRVGCFHINPGTILRSLSGKQWDNAITGFKDVIHEQTHAFNEPRWRDEQLERLAVFDGETMLGGAIVRKVRIPFTRKKLAMVRWGPVWRRFGKTDDLAVMRVVYASLARELSDQQGCFVLFIPRADPEFSVQELAILEELGFKPSHATTSPERYFVNVDQDIEHMRSSLSQKWRYNLKKSEKNGLEASFVSGEQGLNEFFDLYSNMVNRKRFFETSPIDTLHHLMGVEHESLRPEILIVRKDGEPIAGAVLDCSGDQAMYLYGATNKKALELKAGYFMQWEILKHFSGIDRIRWYALGGGTSESCSLHQFKRGLVGKTGVVCDAPCYHHLASSHSTELLGRLAVSLQLTKGTVQKSFHEKLNSLL